jgi:hypothetical protein
MTRYRVPVSGELLAMRPWVPSDRFRLVSVDEPWPGHPGVTLCTFDDDDAPASMAGKLVIPTLRRTASWGVVVVGYSVAGGP